jgi:uncharacterized protein (TIGR03435 family)
MVMALLEDRFQVTVHHEAKEEPGLALTTGKQPPDLAPAKPGEETLIRLDDRRRVIFRDVSMAGLASYLRAIWSTSVIDRTGIAGNFDFSLDPDSFRTASGEAFGFRLEPLKVSRDLTIIDHAERPSEN